MNNAAQKVTRIDKDAWEIATELANEYGVSICHIISESVRYCAENAEFKEMDVVVKRLVVGSKVLEQEGKKMRPKRYPYSGKKESTFVKADPKLVQSFSKNTSFLERLQKKPINFGFNYSRKIDRKNRKED